MQLSKPAHPSSQLLIKPLLKVFLVKLLRLHLIKPYFLLLNNRKPDLANLRDDIILLLRICVGLDQSKRLFHLRGVLDFVSRYRNADLQRLGAIAANRASEDGLDGGVRVALTR